MRPPPRRSVFYHQQSSYRSAGSRRNIGSASGQSDASRTRSGIPRRARAPRIPIARRIVLMSDNKTYLTAEGALKLREELEYLRNVKRPELSARLHFAIKQGDLSENADYIQCKEEMGFLEGRIQALDRMLQNVEILSDDGAPGEARLGSKVTVIEEGFPDKEIFMIVGVAEADPGRGRVQNQAGCSSKAVDSASRE